MKCSRKDLLPGSDANRKPKVVFVGRFFSFFPGRQPTFCFSRYFWKKNDRKRPFFWEFCPFLVGFSRFFRFRFLLKNPRAKQTDVSVKNRKTDRAIDRFGFTTPLPGFIAQSLQPPYGGGVGKGTEAEGALEAGARISQSDRHFPSHGLL